MGGSEGTPDAKGQHEGAAGSADAEQQGNTVSHQAEGGEAAGKGPELSVTPAEAHPLSAPRPEVRPETPVSVVDSGTQTERLEEHRPSGSTDSASERFAPTSTSAPAAGSAQSHHAQQQHQQHQQQEHQHNEDRMHPFIDAIFHHLHIFFRWLSNDGRSAAGFNDLNMSDPYTGLAGGSQIKEGDDSTPNSALVMSYEKCMFGAHPHNIIREDTGPIAPVEEIMRAREQLQGEATAHAV